jgi:PDZ-binding kinase
MPKNPGFNHCITSLNLFLFLPLSVSNPKAEYVGTEPWKPKEALEEGGVITDKADIFAYGLTLWEMMTLAMPHLEIENSEEEGKESSHTLAVFESRALFKRLFPLR